MKILHTSDWHLGKRLNDRERAGEQVAVMDEIVRVADEEAADAVDTSGALFFESFTQLHAVDARTAFPAG